MNRPTRLLAGLAGLPLLLAACSTPDSGIVPEPIITAAPTEDAEPVVPGELPAEPEIVTWGGQDQQLAIVIRNQSDLVVRSSNTVIEALDSAGAVIATVKGDERTTCCAVIGLQPDAELGLFADLDRPISEVADVRVTYLDPQTESEATTAPDDEAPVETKLLGLAHTSDDTVVRVDIDVRSAASPYLVGQAFLVDADDRLVGVVSGRFYCVGPGTQRELHMQLLHPTPTDTRVDRVVVHPVPDGVPPGVSEPCQ